MKNSLKARIIIGTVGVLALLLAPTAAAAIGPTNGFPQVGASPSSIAVNLTVSANSTTLNPYFWGTTISPHARLLPNESALVAATPTQTVVFPGASAGDEYDPFTNTLWDSKTGLPSAPLVNETQFVQWCKGLAPHCDAIFQVPGEIDNPSLAAQIVQYTETTLNFHPAFWEIGNEPALWHHWNESWDNWSTLRAAPPNATQYAYLVQNYTVAMKAVDPSIQIIGLPGVGVGGIEPWVRAVIRVDGPSVAGLAVHEYPAGNVSGAVTLTNFYATLHGVASIPIKEDLVQEWARSQGNTSHCAVSACNVSFFLTEIGSALSHHGYGQFSEGFPGALDMAAQMTQAMSANLTSVDLYASNLDTTNSWFGLAGIPRPDYTLYSQVFPHLGSVVYPVTLTTSPANTAFTNTLYGVSTTSTSSPTRSDLMVVNTNLTTSASFAPRLPAYSPGAPVEVWYWNGSNIPLPSAANTSDNSSTPQPVAAFYPSGLNASWTLPPQSLVLFEAFGSGGAPVTFTESGYPLSQTKFWFLTVDGLHTSTNQTNISVFLPAGGPFSVTAGNISVSTEERFSPSVPSSIVVVNSSPASYQVDYLHQWSVNFSASPNGTGSVSPEPDWGTEGSAINLTAAPARGYLFTRWIGWGPGSVNSTAANISVLVGGHLSEKAYFVLGVPVAFNETGLPSGTPWSVTLDGTPKFTQGGYSLSFMKPANHTYSFQVQPVPGYRSVPKNASVTVNGTYRVVNITFLPTHIPPPVYTFYFNETGLPTGTSWNVTLDATGQMASSTTSSISFLEPERVYGYQVANVTGYRANVTAGSVNVSGPGRVVDIGFQPKHIPPPEYVVYFNETGLTAGTSWNVSIDLTGQTVTSTTSSISFLEPGRATGISYGYRVANVSGYKVNLTAGSVKVFQGSATVLVGFTPRVSSPSTYRAAWTETGLGASPQWGVAVNGTQVTNVGTWVHLYLLNGTYPYQVISPPGFVAAPASGILVIQGTQSFVNVTFTPAVYSASFVETGLPVGTTWTVTIPKTGQTLGSNGTTIVFPEIDGIYGFQLLPVAGYRANLTAGSFDVNLSNPMVFVGFASTAKPTYAVEFVEVGLASGTLWSVTMNGSTLSSATSTITFSLTNRSWGFQLLPVAGYRSNVSSGTVDVNGTAVQVAVGFTPVDYEVIWNETGLGPNPAWGVLVNGALVSSIGGWTETLLANGSYPYQILVPSGYTVNPASGTVVVQGKVVHVQVTVTALLYGVTFVESGLPTGTAWSVRLSNTSVNATLTTVVFQERDHNYTYDVIPPAGYSASPRHGNLSVSGSALEIVITFVPSYTNHAPPPIWTVGGPAVLVVTALGLAAWGTFAALGSARQRRPGARP